VNHNLTQRWFDSVGQLLGDPEVAGPLAFRLARSAAVEATLRLGHPLVKGKFRDPQKLCGYPQPGLGCPPHRPQDDHSPAI
jgi:hypothetical protein